MTDHHLLKQIETQEAALSRVVQQIADRNARLDVGYETLESELRMSNIEIKPVSFRKHDDTLCVATLPMGADVPISYSHTSTLWRVQFPDGLGTYDTLPEAQAAVVVYAKRIIAATFIFPEANDG